MITVLFLGDVVGSAGCDAVRRLLPGIKREYGIDAVIVNGENSAKGNGITPKSAAHLFDSGADVITTGNHVLRKREIYDYLDSEPALLRPANFHPSCPGKGIYVLDRLRYSLCVINLQGLVYMQGASENPFHTIDKLLDGCSTPNIIVDIHAEATSEKLALAWHLDGKVSAVIGTHTHIPTADERVLPGGTGYITDAGMCGGRDSILGVKRAPVIDRFITSMPAYFEEDGENIVMNGVILSIDETCGRCISVERAVFR